MPVPAPADKRFRRAHVRPAKKRVWRIQPRLASLVVGGLLVVAYAAYQGVRWVLSSSALVVTRITVSGNARMSAGEVRTLLSDVVGAGMIGLDLEARRQRLLRAPWVAEASLRRVLPGTVAVAIEERQPMGVGRIGDALYLIDGTGTIVDEFGPNYAELDLPVIDGLVSPSGGETLVEATRATLAGRFLGEMQERPDLAQRVSQIDVSDGRDVVLVLKGDATHVRVGDTRFAERVQSYLDLAPTLREQMPDIDYVDLRFDERVYARSQQTGRPETRLARGEARADEPLR